MGLALVNLDDKYALAKGRVFLSGTQALVRLPMLQRRRDEAAGLKTACFISGYRGSPLGGFDRALWQAKAFVERHGIHFVPGVNEDLAATAVWGSQQAGFDAQATQDGVYAIWYGKGPGVDRSGDAFKHGNMAGSATHGGVLAIAGDDHVCASSTQPHQSEYAFVDAMMPVLNPASVQELMDYGLIGWALSRYAGLWVGLKTAADTVEASATVTLDPHRIEPLAPEDFALPEGGLNIRWPDSSLDQERRLHEQKIPAALAFARANGLDRTVLGDERARFGLVATGKAYGDLLEALEMLGIGADQARRLGIRVYKVAMSWPLEPEGARRFADGLEEILVVEEKRGLVESQLKEILYACANAPPIVGKRNEKGEALLPSAGELNPLRIARAVAARFARFDEGGHLGDHIAYLDGLEKPADARGGPQRRPYFCSGCPHNSSTKVPEGSRAFAGIGCHYMVQWMDRDTETFTQMGAEGANWIGLAPFTATEHVFQNIGDGTYYHSGLLAIRAAIAAGVNITYKILYNDAVAMTGGQPMDGPLDVAMISRQLHGEGVKRIALVTDAPDKYPLNADFAKGLTIHHRRELDAVQRELRGWPGVSALIYDQMCATEKRRRRKRGRLEDPARHVVINKWLCEGCGDCGRTSNCLAVVPVETEFGRKRTIDVASCNKDESCVDGFCPSFVVVKGARLRKPKEIEPPVENLPEPSDPSGEKPYNILVSGIGGTGIVTLSALLGMAAHLEGKSVAVLDHTGLAQKYGAVYSHVRIAHSDAKLHAPRVPEGTADLLLGCELAVAASADSLVKAGRGRTTATVNSRATMTGDFTRDPDFELAEAALERAITEAVRPEGAAFVDATGLAERLVGDAIGANILLLGHAYQRGRLPLGAEAIEQAIRLNGVAVALNLRAFRWGRLAASDPESVRAMARRARPEPAEAPPSKTLEGVVERRVEDLTAYQDKKRAARYRELVERVRQIERERMPGRDRLSFAVARAYHKLLAYKDEYEVGRLYTDGRFLRELEARFEGPYRLEFSLAPPILGNRDPVTGRLLKRSFGPGTLALFRLLARFKFLRGTPFDPFGYTSERRRERRLIEDYEELIGEILEKLSPANHDGAVALAELPQTVRGFGHVKDAAIACAEERQAELLAEFRNPTSQASAA